ncbi:MAG: hypothetical protein IKP07_03685 [Bacilli bacterium]|nr:hypothetical protein [Bacilli bacterium]
MSKELDYINNKIKAVEDKINNPVEYNLPTINAKVRIDDSAVYKEELEILKSIKAKLERNEKNA